MKKIQNENVQKIIRDNIMVLILIGLLLVFGIFAKNFLSPMNLMNILAQNSYFIVTTIGVSIIMISGGTDLSSGNIISVSAVCMGLLMKDMGLPFPVAIVAGIAVSMALGAFNGVVANLLKIHPLIVTLATMTIFSGISRTLAYNVASSPTFFDFDPAFMAIGQTRLLGWLPIPVILMALVALVIHLMLEKTCFGRFIYAVGAPGSDAARLAGINVRRVKTVVFVIAGLLYALSCLMLTSNAGSASSDTGTTVSFDAITASVLGGVSFIGGEGKVKGAVVGCLILGVLSNGMQLAGMGVYAQNIVKGIILILSIGWDTYQRQAKVKKATTK